MFACNLCELKSFEKAIKKVPKKASENSQEQLHPGLTFGKLAQEKRKKSRQQDATTQSESAVPAAAAAATAIAAKVDGYATVVDFVLGSAAIVAAVHEPGVFPAAAVLLPAEDQPALG